MVSSSSALPGRGKAEGGQPDRGGGWAAGEGSGIGADLIGVGAQNNPGDPVGNSSDLNSK